MHFTFASPRALLSVLACSFVIGCGGGGDEQVPTDSVEIVEVTPTGAGADQSTEFRVSFRYSLASKQSGVVNMGFFVDSTNQMLVPQNLVVSRGTGTAMLSATVIPSRYTRSSDFAVGILLSEYPHEATWTPLARDKQFVPLSQ